MSIHDTDTPKIGLQLQHDLISMTHCPVGRRVVLQCMEAGREFLAFGRPSSRTASLQGHSLSDDSVTTCLLCLI